MDGAQTHPRHQHARSRRARESVHCEYTPASTLPSFLLLQCCQQITDQGLPLQVNRIKIPKQLDELVELQNESANPALKVLFKIKAELRGVRCCFNFVLVYFILNLYGYGFKASKYLSPFTIDLVDFYEMLHLPSERQHTEAGCSLVFSVLWVRDSPPAPLC